jgi:hypothetical protein
MTAGAGGRPGFFPGLLFLFVAFGALFVHDLLGLKLPHGLEFVNGSLFPGKNRVADIAVDQVLLVLLMREVDITPIAAADDNLGITAVLLHIGRNGGRSARHQGASDHPDNNLRIFHETYLIDVTHAGAPPGSLFCGPSIIPPKAGPLDECGHPRTENSTVRKSSIFVQQAGYRGVTLLPSASSLHWVKSMGSPHFLQVWARSNSSEKISLASPHFGQLQLKDLRFLKLAYPGQCWGVVEFSTIVISSLV